MLDLALGAECAYFTSLKLEPIAGLHQIEMCRPFNGKLGLYLVLSDYINEEIKTVYVDDV